ncbi:radical SAM family RiPP maturation amino acid epimerase [Dokdonella sp.]|uniref:radical SAM family RiPP maturation amino acid epimerase n=1 Tax=Dokdonella sp. TaxID=2291710 RepID=UPI001B03D629|nr:radical SAM family RiPP maturation amino acid epimerase [Dokdonella sp.]MBO9664751.1 radical SAM family RiPP maturation amino acid epimerase [Dokdonella sp.]
MEIDVGARETISAHRELQVIEASLEDHELRLRLITDPKSVLGTERLLTAEVKRFAELLIGNPIFRKGLQENPRATTEAFGLRLDPLQVRAMWDGQALREGRLTDADLQRDGIRCLNAFNELKRAFAGRMLSAVSSNVAFDAWRRRQIARCRTEVDPANASAIVHAPATFELASGCSVGCWFCGVSAEKYRGAVSYAAIRDDWLAALAGLRDELGPIASKAFLYWGTEPLDNPDYEKYCLDLKAVCGEFPQTTTAIPLRDVERTWEVIKLSTREGCQINRFSILTPRVLHDTLAHFTPAQLLFVELVLHNRGSLMVKADAGRARNSKRLREDREFVAVELGEYASPALQAARPSTIACVSGFLINLAHKEIRLISPCSASDEHPDGYIVFERAAFADGREAVARLRELIARHMPTQLDAATALSFRGDLRYAAEDDGFVLRNEFDTIAIRNKAHPALMQRIGHLIHEGLWNADAISAALGGEFGVADAQARGLLNLLFDKGVLRERAATSS